MLNTHYEQKKPSLKVFFLFIKSNAIDMYTSFTTHTKHDFQYLYVHLNVYIFKKHILCKLEIS